MQRLFVKIFQIKNNWNNVLYVHTPFCLQKCKYCVYASTFNFTQEEFDNFYNEILPRQIKEYEEIFQKVNFNEVYFGGGTPTIANAKILERIYKRIPFFARIPIKSTEASPYTITDGHLELFRKYKFSYVSLGVQTLSKKVLEKNNRLIVTRAKLKDICDQLEKTGTVYNLDLICYLDRGDERDVPQFSRDLEYVMNVLRPVSITIHSNYKTKNSETKTRALIILIKELLGAYPEYRCVNSLLRLKDVKRDTGFYAEYKIMRKFFDFSHYMWMKYPVIPTFGSNVLALGYYSRLNISIPSYIGICGFDPGANRIFHAYAPSAHKTDFDSIRNKINLPYQAARGFFLNKEGKVKFSNLFTSALSKKNDIIKAAELLNDV